MKLDVRDFLPRYAVPVAPLWHFILRDVIIAAVLVGTFLTGMWTKQQITTAQVTAAKAEARYWREVADGVMNGRVKDHVRKNP